jgi:nicotinamide riboside transporter PnuC
VSVLSGEDHSARCTELDAFNRRCFALSRRFQSPLSSALEVIMKLSAISHKKSSLILGGLLLLSFISLTFTEKSSAPPYAFAIFSVIFIAAGLTLNEKYNMLLKWFVSLVMAVIAMYLYFSHPEYR